MAENLTKQYILNVVSTSFGVQIQPGQYLRFTDNAVCLYFYPHYNTNDTDMLIFKFFIWIRWQREYIVTTGNTAYGLRDGIVNWLNVF